jgi:hypothetical protein
MGYLQRVDAARFVGQDPEVQVDGLLQVPHEVDDHVQLALQRTASSVPRGAQGSG